MSSRSTQGLEKRFGYVRCSSCKAEWKSANVWCIRGTHKVFYKQGCKKCHTACTPYRTEPLKCSICHKISKNCECYEELPNPGNPKATDVPEKTRGRSTQGSEKRFGYFLCPTCKSEWKNANVWCAGGTDKVSNRQDCRRCHTSCIPYLTVPLKCSKCHNFVSNCECNNENLNGSDHIPLSTGVPIGGRRKRYGHFRCPSCNAEWKNTNVWCIRGTQKVINKQECRKCHTACAPYLIEPLKCPRCRKFFKNCECPNTSENRHRLDLCHKCKIGHSCVKKCYI